MLFSQTGPRILSYRDFTKIVDGLGEAGTRHVDLCGKGEPLLNPDFARMCEYLNSRNIAFRLTTNGSLLEPGLSNVLLGASVSAVRFSLNSADERTFALVNRPADETSFSRVVDNIRRLREERNKLGLNLQIEVGFVVSKLNVDTTYEMVRLGLSIADSVMLANVTVYDEIRDMALDLTDHEELKRILGECRDEKRLVGASNFLRRVRESAEDYRYHLKGYFDTHRCRVPFSFAVIHADGRVTLCCPTDYVCGNAIQSSFKRIWNSEKARAFRMEALTLPQRRQEVSSSYCYCCDHH
jgi:MoaA/NifB/PqqE/SkfB family radical SAM enzyme